LGASGLVGAQVLRSLADADAEVIAFARKPPARPAEWVKWSSPDADDPQDKPITHWISTAPIWATAERFPLFERHGARRIVALSSTSIFTKAASPNGADARLARDLMAGEALLQRRAEARAIGWTILRPTLIYGNGADKNVSEIARIINRFGFFPLVGEAKGLRQPVHAADVAMACVHALESASARNRAYNISGGETLSYRAMAERIFRALGRPVVTPRVPLVAFDVALAIANRIVPGKGWSSAMAARMNLDMAFDHSEAARDFDFSPRPFAISTADVRPR
jgi:nucleoside-diphosphate-sugar epimerase